MCFIPYPIYYPNPLAQPSVCPTCHRCPTCGQYSYPYTITYPQTSGTGQAPNTTIIESPNTTGTATWKDRPITLTSETAAEKEWNVSTFINKVKEDK